MTTLLSRRTALLAFAATGTSFPILALAGPVVAQTTPAEGGNQADYVQQTLTVGTVALQTSQVALEKAQDAMVKEFAQLEVSEQQAIASVLAATEAGKTPPEVPQEKAAMVQQLTDMEAGPEFDMAYLDGQISGHQELLAIQQTISGNSEATVEAITARLAEQAVTSHLVMLGHLKEMLSGARQSAGESGTPSGSEPAPADGGPAGEGAAPAQPTNG
jgi:putative membrane protein